MLRFAVRRVAQSVPLLLLVSVLVFALIHAAPGGPLELYLSNPNVRPEDIERLRRALGLDRPLVIQYVDWLGAALRGNWGYSIADGRPVLARIGERIPASLELVGIALILSLAAALPAGIAGARRRGGLSDRLVSAVATAGISLPVFWFGLAAQLIFAVALGWLPSSGRTSLLGGDLADELQHLIMPAGVLAMVLAAAWSRYLRASLTQTLAQGYVVSARARGLSPSAVLWRHAMRAALGPFVTVAMLDAALLLSGAVVTESVFAWPGLGSLFTDALAKRDYTVLMAFLMLSAVAVIVSNVIADIIHRALDPRSGE